jgi:hypothetical protein
MPFPVAYLKIVTTETRQVDPEALLLYLFVIYFYRDDIRKLSRIADPNFMGLTVTYAELEFH